MTAIAEDRGRIAARIPARVQATLEAAASLVGATTNPFVVQSALREAERIIEQERVIHLSARDAKRFLAALDAPPPLNAKLTAALKNHSKRHNDSTGTLSWAPRQKCVCLGLEAAESFAQSQTSTRCCERSGRKVVVVGLSAPRFVTININHHDLY